MSIFFENLAGAGKIKIFLNYVKIDYVIHLRHNGIEYFAVFKGRVLTITRLTNNMSFLQR